MNIVQRPKVREFCSTMQDYIIDTDSTITFAVQYGGKTILEEEYVPDAQYKVRTRGLGKFCELALWGVWCAGENTTQPDAAGTFTFLVNGIEDMKCFVMFSRLQTKKDAAVPGCLSEVSTKVTRPGIKEYVSGFLLSNPAAPKSHGVQVTAYWSDGSQESKFHTVISTAGAVSFVFSVDVSPDLMTALFSKADVESYKVEVSGGAMLFYVDRTRYADMWCFRFKNVYDMPETLTVTGGLKLTGNNESDTAAMYGVERKFGVKVTDEYTANSGVVMLQSDYKLWHNLLNSQEASILHNDEWLPIVITKQKFEREFRRSVLKTVEFSFRLADPEQNNLIGYD